MRGTRSGREGGSGTECDPKGVGRSGILVGAHSTGGRAVIEKLDIQKKDERADKLQARDDAGESAYERRNIAEEFYREATARPDVREILRRLAKL